MRDLEKTNRWLVGQVDSLTGQKAALLNHVALMSAIERVRGRKLDADLQELNEILASAPSLEGIFNVLAE